MADEYKKPYFILFNGITDTLTSLDAGKLGEARARLIRAQQEAEEAYINEGEPEKHSA